MPAASHDDRGHMQLGAALAGLAIENSMLGAAHAAANPLTARHNVITGMRCIDAAACHALQREDPAAAPSTPAIRHPAGAVDPPLIDWVRNCRPVRFPRSPATDLAVLAEDATRQWTGKFNPGR